MISIGRSDIVQTRSYVPRGLIPKLSRKPIIPKPSSCQSHSLFRGATDRQAWLCMQILLSNVLVVCQHDYSKGLSCSAAITLKTSESHENREKESVPYMRPLQRLPSSASFLQIRVLRCLSDAQRLGSKRASQLSRAFCRGDISGGKTYSAANISSLADRSQYYSIIAFPAWKIFNLHPKHNDMVFA